MKTNLFTLLILITISNGQSFDCSKVLSNIEIEICNDPLLSALDDSLSTLYHKLLLIDSNYTEGIKSSQNEWLTIRNRMDKEGAVNQYQKRIDVLTETIRFIQSLPNTKRNEKQMSGTYHIPHKIEIVWDDNNSLISVMDEYVFYWNSDSTVDFALSTIGYNGHSCGLSGTAILDRESGNYIYKDGTERECVYTIFVKDSTVHFITPKAFECVKMHCGAKAIVGDVSLSVSRRVSRIIDTDISKGR